MTFTGWLTIVLFAVILTALAIPLGALHGGASTRGADDPDPIFRVPERLLYKVCGSTPTASRTGRPTRRA